MPKINNIGVHKTKSGGRYGKPVFAIMDEFSEKRGGEGVGGYFRSKKLHCNFFALETAILVTNFRKNFEKGGSFLI